MNQTRQRESTAEEDLFECSHQWISPIDSKARTTQYSTIQPDKKALLVLFKRSRHRISFTDSIVRITR